jgi:hypothetical protein
LLASCSSPKSSQSNYFSGNGNSNGTFTITEVSTDETYGYTEKNPVKVGGGQSGPANERKYLNSLTGPNGEELKYERKGSCCPFETPNGFMGGGMLDRYEVTYAGLSKPIIIYINMYDKDVLKAPKGFKFKE